MGMLIAVILLAVLQGLTEFLPVSSSGHLLLARKLTGREGPWWLAFDVSVHIGTLLAVFVFFRRDFLKLLKAAPAFIRRIFQPKRLPPQSADERLIGLVLLATLPTMLFGLGVEVYIMQRDVPLWFVGIGLLVTGATLCVLGNSSNGKGLADMRAPDAFFAGLIQGLATLPGVSRSGFTIAALLMRGMAPDAAVRFSFVAATPAIIGAGVLRIVRLYRGGAGLQLGHLVCGALVAAAVGYVALVLLMGVLRRKWFGHFSYYLVPLGIATLILSLVLKK